jgi:hypothetical protein
MEAVFGKWGLGLGLLSEREEGIGPCNLQGYLDSVLLSASPERGLIDAKNVCSFLE